MRRQRTRRGGTATLTATLAALGLTVTGAEAAAAPAPQSSSGASLRATLANAWSDLWWRRDQQGERLLAAGEPERAARRFRDPRRRAYADLQAGHDAQATQLLAPYHDARSLYNRGNALAHTGQLQAALDAYDAALALAPQDHDTRHNRDLVASLLKHQPSTPQSAQPGSQPQSHPQQRHQPTPSAGSQPSPQPSSARPGQTRSQAVAGRQGPGSTSGAGTAASGKQPAAAASGQAGRLAQSGQANRGPPAGATAALAGAARPPRPAPAPSEQTLSLEQWLRRIPDDPAGLLRRKFLIEHLMRHPGSGDGPSQDE